MIYLVLWFENVSKGTRVEGLVSPSGDVIGRLKKKKKKFVWGTQLTRLQGEEAWWEVVGHWGTL